MIHRTISGWCVRGGPRVTRQCVVLESKIGQYDERRDYAELIGEVLRLAVENHECRTLREDQRWQQVVSETDVVFLDVTACNHIPMVVQGSRLVQGRLDKLLVKWEAWLVAVERIDEQPLEPARMVATYRVEVW